MPKIICTKYIPTEVEVDIPNDIHEGFKRIWGSNPEQLKRAYHWYVNQTLPPFGLKTAEQTVAAGRQKLVLEILSILNTRDYFRP